MSFPWVLSMCVGFLSLSQEILWMRYVGFSSHTVPWAFTFVLMIYLVGIARGAMVGRDYCEKSTALYSVAGKMLLLGAALDIAGPFIAPVPRLHLTIVIFIYLCAFLKGICFPIAHHLGSSTAKGQVGKSVSRVYFMNIVGAALGPLLTGFWLVDQVSLQTAMVLMGVLTGWLGFACLMREGNKKTVALAAVAALVMTGALLLPQRLTSVLACYPYDRASLGEIIETKSGIIHSAVSTRGGGDYTFGANVYDGRLNIDPRVNSNGLQRVFVLAALRPEPKNVLVIGLSSGAWTRILSGFAGVQNIDVVEINPGYLKIIQGSPVMAPLLKDPRIHINIDDGRRWLKQHPDNKYDLIVMNTTYYWRAYSTNLLSQQFLRLVQGHLQPGGIMTYNTTGSPDVLKTAESVFPYAFQYFNFVIAGNSDFRPLQKTGEKELLKIKLDGKPVFDPDNKKDQDFITSTLNEWLATSAQERPTEKWDGEVITDWNMITEFKRGMQMSFFCR